MVSHYIAHVIRCLDKAKSIPSDQIRKILGMEEELYQRLLTDTDGSLLTLQHVDNLVNFFGMGIFKETLVKEMFIYRESQYKSWDTLEPDDQKLINIAQLYISATNAKNPIVSMNYAKECSYFLDSCENMVSILKDADTNEDDEEGAE